MSEPLIIVLLTGGAGACIPAGGVLASFEHIRPRWLEEELRHFVIAFGGGILLGAVAVVLVPEGTSRMGHSPLSVAILLAGGLAFFALERVLERRGSGTPQLTGMLLDYLPEAIALGGLAATGAKAAPLLALLIGLQNLPEGFNAYREVRALGAGRAGTLLAMAAMALLGPLAGLAGFYFLSAHQAVLGAIMLFAAGGILYLIFQDIAPQSRLEKHWAPPLGAVFGFCLALSGEMLVVSR